MTHDLRAIRAIVRKDLRQVTSNKGIVLPMVILPAILLVLMPVLMVLLPRFVGPEELGLEDLQGLFRSMPSPLARALEGLPLEQTWIMLSANYMFAPMFLIVPLMVSSIIAADSFVGERERRTLEALLYTPVSDADLYAAKVLAALLPALVINVGSFVLMAIAVNAAGYGMMGRLFFPSAPWWPMVFWLGPAVSVMGIGATVLISSRSRTFMQAQQTSGALVLPIVVLMIGQLSGMLFLGVGLILALGALVMAIGVLLITIGARRFSRGELMARV